MGLFKSTKKTIQYIIIIYAVLYLMFLISDDFAEGNIIYLLFVLFIVGFWISWYNKIIAGIIFLLWYIGVFIYEVFFVEKDGGLGLVLGIPLVIIGIDFITNGMKKKS